MAASKWDCETTIKFIQEYKSHECLWNFKSNMYKNRQMRDSAYFKIIEAMNVPGFGVPECNNKIKNLGSTYSQEMKKIEDSKRSGAGVDDIYEPNIKWFKELEAVYKDNDKRKTHDTYRDTTSEIETTSGETPQITTQENNPLTTPSLPKKRVNNATAQRRNEIVRAVTEMKSLHSSINSMPEEDNFDFFGKSVAAQPRQLSLERALLAQSRIQNLLSDLGIEELRDKAAAKRQITSSYSYSSPSSVSVSSSDVGRDPMNTQSQFSPVPSTLVYARYDTNDTNDLLMTAMSNTFGSNI